MKAVIIETGEVLSVKKIYQNLIVLVLNKPFNLSINLQVDTCILQKSKVQILN